MRNWLLWLIGREEMVELERWRVEWNEHRRWMAEFELARATLDHMRGCVDGQPMNSMQNLRDSFRTATQPPAVGVDVSEEMVFLMSCWMAEDEGCDDPHQLIWEGQPPEPWGEVWNRYEDRAREALTAALRTGGGES